MNNNSSNNNLNGKHHFSIVLSFAVAMFAIISLIAVGFNQISFAAPNDGTNTDSSFKLATYQRSVVDPMSGQSTIKPVSINSYNSLSGNNGYKVPIMYVDNGSETPDINSIVPVFCIGKKSEEAGVSLNYNNSGKIEDSGIAYILSRSRVYSGNDDISIVPKGTGGANYMFLEIYATQVALWMYQGDDSLQNLTNVSDATIYSLADPANNPVQGSNEYFTGNIFNYIQDVVNKARTEGPNKIVGKNLVVSVDENYSDVEGTNYYQTSLIQVVPTPSDDFISYDLSFDGVEGMFAVDENGTELSNLNGLLASDKVYIRIPKDKVGEGVNTINIKANGHFKNVPAAYKYMVDSDHQAIVRLESGDGVLPAQTSLTIMASPDTGASTSQTIYFIGLVVLLCGVGIIYANSKAIKNV